MSFSDLLQPVLGVLAIIATIIPAVIAARRKRFTYGVLTKESLVTVHDELKGRIRILVDGNDVENVYLIVMTFVNAGNIAIKASDFVKPVQISFGSTAQILAANVVLVEPKNVDVTPSLESDPLHNGHVVEIAPTLLNTGDLFTLKILVARPEKTTVQGRIVDVKDIVSFFEYQKRSQYLIPFCFFAALVGSLWVGYRPYRIWSPEGIAQVSLVYGGIIGFFYIRWTNLYLRTQRLLRKNNYEIRDQPPGAFDR